MSTPIERPDCLIEDHLVFLDDLRESGAINMFGAPAYLQEQWDELTTEQARAITSYWMKTFSTRRKTQEKTNGK